MNSSIRASTLAFFLVALAASTGCGKDKKEGPCTLGDSSTCENGQACEVVVGGEPACFAPVVVKGQVFNGTNDAAVSGASVVALDANGQAVALATTTDASGNYSLSVPTSRTADGTVVAGSAVTLRVDAQTFVAFPTPPRFAIPIDLTVSTMSGSDLVVMSTATDVSLFPIPASSTQYGTIEGTSSADAAGALAVAEQGGKAVSTAIVGDDGKFTLLNVPVGVVTSVTAYAQGVHTSTATATVASSGGKATVTLTVDANGVAVVEGDINAVNAPNFTGTDPTSVLLVLESTFSDLTKAGLVPAGLRDGTLTASDRSFRIEGVPPGKYILLAAFENDGIVRDPDVLQGGASIRHVDVSATGVVTVTPESLSGVKVTDAITTVGPGAEGLEVVTTSPTFQWSKDSGADHYEFRIFDAYGAIVYQDLAVAQPGGSAPIPYTVDAAKFLPSGSGFTSGMIYQFRVLSVANGGEYISSTEDLRGLFEYQP